MAACLRRKSNRVKRKLKQGYFCWHWSWSGTSFGSDQDNWVWFCLALQATLGRENRIKVGPRASEVSSWWALLSTPEQCLTLSRKGRYSFLARCQYRRRRGSPKGLRISLLKRRTHSPAPWGHEWTPCPDPSSAPSRGASKVVLPRGFPPALATACSPWNSNPIWRRGISPWGFFLLRSVVIRGEQNSKLWQGPLRGKRQVKTQARGRFYVAVGDHKERGAFSADFQINHRRREKLAV